MNQMIIVTGASGQLGHQIALALAARLPARAIGATTRDPSKVADLAALGVRVRAGDFADPASLHHAFEGASQVLIVSSNAAATGGDPLVQHRAAIDAARRAGAGRIVYASHMAASATSAFPPMRDHAATEAMLRDAAVPWTALRNGFYGASAIAMLRGALASGTLETSADGKVAWTAHADLAEAAAIILAEPGRFEGPTPSLTGAEALDFSELAAQASAVSLQPLRHQLVAVDHLRARVPPRAAPLVLGLYAAAAAGEFAATDPTLATLLGRAPATMRQLLTAAFAPAST